MEETIKKTRSTRLKFTPQRIPQAETGEGSKITSQKILQSETESETGIKTGAGSKTGPEIKTGAGPKTGAGQQNLNMMRAFFDNKIRRQNKKTKGEQHQIHEYDPNAKPTKSSLIIKTKKDETEKDETKKKVSFAEKEEVFCYEKQKESQQTRRKSIFEAPDNAVPLSF